MACVGVGTSPAAALLEVDQRGVGCWGRVVAIGVTSLSNFTPAELCVVCNYIHVCWQHLIAHAQHWTGGRSHAHTWPSWGAAAWRTPVYGLLRCTTQGRKAPAHASRLKWSPCITVVLRRAPSSRWVPHRRKQRVPTTAAAHTHNARQMQPCASAAAASIHKHTLTPSIKRALLPPREEAGRMQSCMQGLQARGSRKHHPLNHAFNDSGARQAVRDCAARQLL
jgi:hypothetical protein